MTVLASVEVLAVDVYTAVRDAGTAGELGVVPPALARYFDTALGQHQAALLAWNGVLTDAGLPVVTSAPVRPAASIGIQLGAVADAAGAARVVFSLERLVADTHLEALRDLLSAPAIRLAGSILSIQRQHMSVLMFAAGQYPVPETFASAEFAYVP